jgi:hypothetical protein
MKNQLGIVLAVLSLSACSNQLIQAPKKSSFSLTSDCKVKDSINKLVFENDRTKIVYDPALDKRPDCIKK